MLECLFICLLYLQFSILSTYDCIFIYIFLSYFHLISMIKKHPITLKATQVDLYTKASSPYVLLAFRVIRQNELVDYVPTRQRGLSLMTKSSSLYSCYVVYIPCITTKKGGKISQCLLLHSWAYMLAGEPILFTVENTDRVKDAKNGYPCICKNCHPHICKAKYTSHHNNNFYSNCEENILPCNGQGTFCNT